jgi:Tfp pilus assembly protein PilF
MKPIVLLISLCISIISLQAQQNDPDETARTFIRQGDYNNAVLVLNKAIEKDRDNIELKKDLAMAYYMQRDYTRSMDIARPLSESAIADVQTFQILGMNYKAIEERKEAEKMYRAALKRFPQSGALYSEFGEMLWSKSDFTEATRQWQKGIQVDPNHSGNYYNLAKFYYMSADKVWGLIYGEMFVNLESYSKRTPEIKTMLLEGYKKLFTESDMMKGQDVKNDFVKAFLSTMENQAQVINAGVTPETLSALRTRFILEWFDKNAGNFPFRLFEYQQQLAKGGMFDAYNQWIFGTADNLSAFQQWTVTHSEEYNKFNTFQKNRVFKVPSGQNYQK